MTTAHASARSTGSPGRSDPPSSSGGVRSPRRSSGTVLASIVFAAMIAAVLYRYWPGDERSIRRHLSNLSETLSLPGEEGEVQKITRFAALREYFADDVRIRVGSEEFVSKDAVFAALDRVRPPPGGLHVDFADVVVRLADDGPTAAVSLTAKVSQTDPITGEARLDAEPATLSMVKLRGDWVIAGAQSSRAR